MEGFDCLGAEDEMGLDLSALAPAAEGLAQGVYTQVKDEQAKDKLSADESKKLAASISADVAAAGAMARADISAPKVGRVTMPTADADAAAAKLAVASSDKAGAALGPDSVTKRADAADKALADAVAREQKSPKDEYQAALVRAWTTISNKAHGGAIASSDAPAAGGGKGGKRRGSDEEKSWFVRPVLGPIPGGGVLALGAGVLGGVAFAVKKFLLK